MKITGPGPALTLFAVVFVQALLIDAYDDYIFARVFYRPPGLRHEVEQLAVELEQGVIEKENSSQNENGENKRDIQNDSPVLYRYFLHELSEP